MGTVMAPSIGENPAASPSTNRSLFSDRSDSRQRQQDCRRRERCMAIGLNAAASAALFDPGIVPIGIRDMRWRNAEPCGRCPATVRSLTFDEPRQRSGGCGRRRRPGEQRPQRERALERRHRLAAFGQVGSCPARRARHAINVVHARRHSQRLGRHGIGVVTRLPPVRYPAPVRAALRAATPVRAAPAAGLAESQPRH